MNPALTHLECTRCGEHADPRILQTLCACGATYYARYDLERASAAMPRDSLGTSNPDMWRYRHVLPVAPDRGPITLGEGGTPTISAGRLGEAIDLAQVFVKDETQNPTGSFKARGMSAAISAAVTLGVRRAAVPSAGNAALSAAAYCARVGMPLEVYLPRRTPRVFLAAIQALGATAISVDGSLADAGAEMNRRLEGSDTFSLATLREPYRVEGKKTMGYELAEGLGWELPDVIVYPTGGGTGLLGMWKAFDEMEEMGWIDSRRPRMVAVQAAGCAPIVDAFESGATHASPVEDPQTIASGLRVPRTIGDFIILDLLRRDGGIAVAVTDRELLAGASLLARTTGIFGSPEVGAVVAAARHLRRTGYLSRDDRVVLFATGTGLSYVEPGEAPAGR